MVITPHRRYDALKGAVHASLRAATAKANPEH
jgi:hypothetical protein